MSTRDDRKATGGVPARGVIATSLLMLALATAWSRIGANRLASTGVGGSTGERSSSLSDDRLLGVTGPLELDTHSSSSSLSEFDEIVKSGLALAGR